MVTLTSDISVISNASAWRSPVKLHDAVDCFDGAIDPLRDILGGGFERARPRRRLIKLARQPRPIGAERVDMLGERLLAAIGLAPPLGRGLQGVERMRKPALRDVDRVGLAHGPSTAAIRGRTIHENRATAIVYRRNLTSYRGKASTSLALACA